MTFLSARRYHLFLFLKAVHYSLLPPEMPVYSVTCSVLQDLAQLFLLQDELCSFFRTGKPTGQDHLRQWFISPPTLSSNEVKISAYIELNFSVEAFFLMLVCVKYLNVYIYIEREISVFVYRKFPAPPLSLPWIICQVNLTI